MTVGCVVELRTYMWIDTQMMDNGEHNCRLQEVTMVSAACRAVGVLLCCGVTCGPCWMDTSYARVQSCLEIDGILKKKKQELKQGSCFMRRNCHKTGVLFLKTSMPFFYCNYFRTGDALL
jgi:hypothetical protein